jgi:hypothetical protein
VCTKCPANSWSVNLYIKRWRLDTL